MMPKMDGYEFTLPKDYDLTYGDNIGPVVFKENIFQMRMSVLDDSYENVMKRSEELTQAMVDAGGTIVQDVKEIEDDGRKYAYYKATLQDDSMFVIYTATPDGSQRFAGQIVLLGEQTSDEFIIEMFSEITANSKKTEKKDSTKDDIVVERAKKKPSSIERTWIEENTIEFGKSKLTYQIPNNFFLEDEYEGSDYASQRYCMYEPYVNVECSLFENSWYENAQDYITKNKHLENAKVQTMNIEGKDVYYIEESFLHDGKEYQQIYAGYDVGDQSFFVVEGYDFNEESELTIDLIRDFLLME